ncbi:MAG TPA: hypothetical protein VJR04_15255 [Terriglobales bacterium]|nr:hypothetical protein [Terriglobales bacterium]
MSVLETGIEPQKPTLGTYRFFGLVEAAEFDQGLTAGFFGGHADA